MSNIKKHFHACCINMALSGQKVDESEGWLESCRGRGWSKNQVIQTMATAASAFSAASTAHRLNIEPMFGRRRRRWANIWQTLDRCVVFAGIGQSRTLGSMPLICRPLAFRSGEMDQRVRSSHCWFNAGPTSLTLAQRWTNVGSSYPVTCCPVDNWLTIPRGRNGFTCIEEICYLASYWTTEITGNGICHVAPDWLIVITGNMRHPVSY